jgi:hypothetical protein
MRKVIVASWFIIVLSFSALFVSSIIYEIDAFYTMRNFEFELNEVSIVKNSTDDIVSLRVSANISNPSSLSDFTLYTLRVYVYVNNQRLSYLKTQKWFVDEVPPQDGIPVQWAYLDLQEKDLETLNQADSDNTWNWFFQITVTLISNLLGTEEYDRSQSFTGVKFISVQDGQLIQ